MLLPSLFLCSWTWRSVLILWTLVLSLSSFLYALLVYDFWDMMAEFCRKKAEITAATNVPHIQDIVTRQQNLLFGHIALLDHCAPARRTRCALSLDVIVRCGSSPNPG